MSLSVRMAWKADLKRQRMSKAGQTRVPPREAGYTYAALLVLLFALALGAQATTIPTQTALQREAELELIHRGQMYARAVASYWRADPDNPAFPPSLDALLDDPRASGRRHIRRLLDPVIANEWRLVSADAGGIAGVAPVSDAEPFRRSDLPPEIRADEAARTYAEWEFVFDPAAGE